MYIIKETLGLGNNLLFFLKLIFSSFFFRWYYRVILTYSTLSLSLSLSLSHAFHPAGETETKTQPPPNQMTKTAFHIVSSCNDHQRWRWHHPPTRRPPPRTAPHLSSLLMRVNSSGISFLFSLLLWSQAAIEHSIHLLIFYLVSRKSQFSFYNLCLN